MPMLQFGRHSSTRDSSLNINTKDVGQQGSNPVGKRVGSNYSSASSENSSAPPTIRRPSFSMDHILHPMKDKKDKKDDQDRDSRKDKRHSLAMRPSSNSKDRKGSESPRPHQAAELSLAIESPPLVLYGPASASTGALLSGRLKLTVTDPRGECKLVKFTMRLVATIVMRKPVVHNCPDCIKRINNVNEWKFLSEPKTFQKPPADNQFPFSFLLPGHLPATTHASLAQIDYSLSARAVTAGGEILTYTHPLTIQRAIPPGPDKASIRIFPPTHLAGRIVLPPVIHPIGAIPLQMVLSGVVDKTSATETRWRLRKMMWRIEEHQKMTSPACAKHVHKVGEGKAIQHQDTRVVGQDETKGGWKTDFDTAGGEIQMEFEVVLDPTRHAICDVESPIGLEVRHNLVIELIVAEEFCPRKDTRIVTPTGAARVLRMQFNLAVTQRAGMGISWDEEMPPVYDDVPESPPGYKFADAPGAECTIEDYTGEDLEYEDLERMHSENPNDPPMYRERSPVQMSGESSLHPPPWGQRRPASTGSSREGAANSPRVRAQGVPSGNASGSRTGTRWTEDELGAEPPQYALRPQRNDGEEATEDIDVGQGEAAQ